MQELSRFALDDPSERHPLMPFVLLSKTYRRFGNEGHNSGRLPLVRTGRRPRAYDRYLIRSLDGNIIFDMAIPSQRVRRYCQSFLRCMNGNDENCKNRYALFYFQSAHVVTFILLRRLDEAVIASHPVWEQPPYTIAFGMPAVALNHPPRIFIPSDNAALAQRQ